MKDLENQSFSWLKCVIVHVVKSSFESLSAHTVNNGPDVGGTDGSFCPKAIFEMLLFHHLRSKCPYTL